MLLQPFLERAAEDPTRPFLTFEGSTIGYGEASATVDAVAVALAALGIGPGDRVALVCPNRPDFVLVWFAVLRLGGVFVPLDPRLRGWQQAELLARTGVALLVLAEGHERPDWPGRTVGLDDLRAEAAGASAPAGPWPEVDPTATASILFTSGTTGSPKGVVLSHRSYAAAGALLAEVLALTEDDRILVCLPLFHANPQFYAVLSAIQQGASVVILPGFSASSFWSDAAASGATGFTYVGSVLSILAGTAPESKVPTLRFCVGGGAPPDAWARLEDDLGTVVHELYGMTETGSFATINGARRRRGTCGLARPDVEVAVLDHDDRVVPAGTPGEIAVRPRSPSVLFDGYDGMPEVTLQAFRNLWFHTGDLGRLDEDGFLHFLGRSGHVIRRGGENLSPAAIESVLAEHPGVREVAVVGVDDDVLGQEIKAVIVAEGALDVADLVAHAADRLPRFMRPRYVECRPELPRTSTQKVQVEALRELGPEVLLVDPGP